jgi:hypothetical protein
LHGDLDLQKDPKKRQMARTFHYDRQLATTCPVCGGRFDGLCCRLQPRGDGRKFECETCGVFEISRTAFDDLFAPRRLTDAQLAVLSHRIRRAQSGSATPLVTTQMVEALRSEQLPSQSQQVRNLVRLMGDEINVTGVTFIIHEAVGSIVGLRSKDAQFRLIKAVADRGWIRQEGQRTRTRPQGSNFIQPSWDLTLDGWDRYEAEQRGQAEGDFGFLAMKFGDTELDQYVSSVIKPGVKAQLNYNVVDMRDVSRAGIIDNLMRAQIRDAAFVLVDLTHDNPGAYWEAGYAEGLGKPVIYICERAKFSVAQTHFDTNHCTTVPWSADKPDRFVSELVATLRRSLNLFPHA